MQDERMRDFEQLGRKYSAIGPLLTKLEGVVVNTNTGKSPKMAPYYAHCEKKIFDTVYKVSRAPLISLLWIFGFIRGKFNSRW